MNGGARMIHQIGGKVWVTAFVSPQSTRGQRLLCAQLEKSCLIEPGVGHGENAAKERRHICHVLPTPDAQIGGGLQNVAVRAAWPRKGCRAIGLGDGQ